MLQKLAAELGGAFEDYLWAAFVGSDLARNSDDAALVLRHSGEVSLVNTK